LKIEFTVPSVPVAQPRQRVGMVGGHARQFLPGKHPVNAYKASVALSARESYSGAPLEGPIALRVVFVLPRPGRLIWKSRPMPRVRHASKPDPDNLLKSICDALNAKVWRDDAQVSTVTVEKWIASGDEQPHVEVCIETID